MSVESRIARLEQRIASGYQDHAIQQHYNKYREQHPATKMDFDRFTQLYGSGVAGKDPASKIIGFTKSINPRTQELDPIYDTANHPGNQNLTSEDHYHAMQLHKNKALEAQNHPLSILHGKEIQHHNEQATQHYLKSHSRQPLKAAIEDLETRLANIGAPDISHLTAGQHRKQMDHHQQQIHKLTNHHFVALHKDLIDHHKRQYLRHSQHLKNLTNPEPHVYDLTKHF